MATVNGLVPGTFQGQVSADGGYEWDGIAWNLLRTNIDNPLPLGIGVTLADVVIGNLPIASGTGMITLPGPAMTIQNVTWLRYRYEGDNDYFRVINEVTGFSTLERSQPTPRI